MSSHSKSRQMIFRSGHTGSVRARRSRRPNLEPMGDRTLLSSGQLDPTFGYQGIVPLQYAANDVVSYPDGRFLVAGTGSGNYGGEGYSFPYVQRYTADGQLDPTFGTLGTAVEPNGSNVFAANLGGFDVALEPDGKIVESVEYNVGAQLIRFNPDGSLDATFGTSGATAPLDFNVAGQMIPLNAGYGNVAVLPDGRILLAGEVAGSVGLAIYGTDGTLDPSFNGNGTLLATTISGYPAGLEVVNNKILILSDLGELARFNLDGSPDTTFGTAGVTTVPGLDGGGALFSLAVLPDGKILVNYAPAGNEEGGFYDSVARFNVDGSPDQSFGTSGQVTYGSATVSDENFVSLSNIQLQPDGKILIGAAYNAYSGVQPELLRLNPDGSTDSSFGNNGLAAPQPTVGSLSLITVQPSGRTILAIETGGNVPFELAGVVGDPVVAFGGATSVSTSSGTSTAVYDVSEIAGSATITLQRGGDLSQALSVQFSTDDSGGLAGVNYTSVNTTVTFAAGSATATVTIPILNDPDASAPIDVPLVLGAPSDGAILGNVADGDLHIVRSRGL
jgi:uncharacterized delta-60 repeat protein